MTTISPEKWGLKESADWWSAGQAARHQIFGAVTEMMLDLASVQRGSRVLDVAAGSGESFARGSSPCRRDGICACRGYFR